MASTSGPFTFENADIQTVVITLEAFTVKVVPLNYARAHEMAYTLSWVAPPSVQIVPYYPTNSLSLIISGHPAAVEGLVGIIK